MAVEGIPKLLTTLEGLAAKAERDAAQSVEVGYSADYAILVHEDMEAVHPNGQANFLLQPARLLKDEMARMIAKAVAEGKSVTEAELEAGQFLLAESQKLVPVQTGFLRDSGYAKAV